MPLTVRRFQAGDLDALNRLNARLSAGGARDIVYPEGPDLTTEPLTTGPRRQRLYVAASEGELHGGVWLLQQRFRVAGETIQAGWVKYPVSESLVDGRYSGVPASLLFALTREESRLMALGMGGETGPLARLLKAMRWEGETIPFLFRIERPARVLRRLKYARASRARRLALDFLAWSGLGWLGNALLSQLPARVRRPSAGVEYSVEPAFGDWADHTWSGARDSYGFLAERTQAALNDAYPDPYPGLSRLRVRRNGEEIGWVVTLRLNLRNVTNPGQFGRLSVGVVADGLAQPSDAADVMAVGARHIAGQDVDLIISNQSHPAWIHGLERLGFHRGPSNFAFYRSAEMNRAMAGAGPSLVNRGDCDGPKWV